MSYQISRDSDPMLDFSEVSKSAGNTSRSTLWRMWRRGDFPKPIAISPGRVGWLKSEIDAWKTSRASLRTHSEPNRSGVEVIHAR